MKKIKIIAIALFIAVSPLIAVDIADAANYSYCPGSSQMHGWWGTITPSYRLCGTTYYTWNTTSLASEESWFLSDPTYISCHKGTPPFGPTYYNNLVAVAYIPYFDASQTYSAHYYRWHNSSSYGMIGYINQYATFGWVNMSTTTWHYTDRFKLSDWTNETKYSKHVDMDGFRFTNCPS